MVGQLMEVRKCPTLKDFAVHRRDQSSELRFATCQLERDHLQDGTQGLRVKIMMRKSGPSVFTCRPCHWICALPTVRGKLHVGEGYARLLEFLSMSEGSTSLRVLGNGRQQLPAGHRLAAPAPYQDASIEPLPAPAPVQTEFPQVTVAEMKAQDTDPTDAPERA